MTETLIAPLRLAGRLWWRHWPQLFLLVLLGSVANAILLEAAVRIGFANHVLGVCALSALVLAKLVVLVAMFHVLRASLPILGTGGTPESLPGRRETLLHGIALALAPFFAYYTAWGFLGVSVRQYSLRALSIDPFGEHGMILDAITAPGLLGVVVAAWLLRKGAQALEARGHAPPWKLLITLCEAIWLFIGLFVISKWKDQIGAWWHSRELWHWGESGVAAVGARLPGGWLAAAKAFAGAFADVFWYALLPLVWLAMAALIYGRDVRSAGDLTAASRHAAKLAQRYRGLPGPLHAFGEHLVKSYRTRFLPVANGIRLTLSAGLPLLILLCVGYRALGWLGLWAWIGSAQLIGAHSLALWRVIGDALALVLVDPLGISASLVIEPLRICLLAAILETALAAGGRVSMIGASSPPTTTASAAHAT